MILASIIGTTALSDRMRADELIERSEKEKDAKIASEMKEEVLRLEKREHKLGTIGDILMFLGL